MKALHPPIRNRPPDGAGWRVGKRLSDRAYITYEQGLTAVAGITKLTYNLTPKITVVTRAGLDNAIDVFYTLRFD